MSTNKTEFLEYVDDHSNYTRVPNSLIRGTQLSPNEKLIIIYMLSMRSDFDYSQACIANDINISKKTVSRVLKSLEKKQIIVITKEGGEISNYHIKSPYNWQVCTDMCPEVPRDNLSFRGSQSDFYKVDRMSTNNNTNNNTNIKSAFDFEKLYQEYPKRVGKQKGLAKLEKTIKTQAKYEEFRSTMKKYIQYCETNKRFLKDFSTFVNQWQDLVDEVSGVDSPSDMEFRSL